MRVALETSKNAGLSKIELKISQKTDESIRLN